MQAAPFSPQSSYQMPPYSSYTQQSNYQPINQSLNQSMNQPMTQSINQPMTQPIKTQSSSYYSATQPLYVQSYRSIDTNHLQPTNSLQYSIVQQPLQSLQSTSSLPPSYPSYITQPLNMSMNYAYPVDEEPRRTRRIKSNHAVRVLKAAFAANPKPSKEAMRAWQGETGCSYTEICRWFRNERFRIRQETNKLNSGKGDNQSVDGQVGNGVALSVSQANTQSTVVDQSTATPSSSVTQPAAQSNTVSVQSNNEQTPHTTQQRTTSPYMTAPSSPASSCSVVSHAGQTSTTHSHPKPEISEWIAQFQEEFSFDQQQRALAALLQKQHAANRAHHEQEVHHSPEVM